MSINVMSTVLSDIITYNSNIFDINSIYHSINIENVYTYFDLNLDMENETYLKLYKLLIELVLSFENTSEDLDLLIEIFVWEADVILDLADYHDKYHFDTFNSFIINNMQWYSIVKELNNELLKYGQHIVINWYNNRELLILHNSSICKDVVS